MVVDILNAKASQAHRPSPEAFESVVAGAFEGGTVETGSGGRCLPSYWTAGVIRPYRIRQMATTVAASTGVHRRVEIGCKEGLPEAEAAHQAKTHA